MRGQSREDSDRNKRQEKRGKERKMGEEKQKKSDIQGVTFTKKNTQRDR